MTATATSRTGTTARWAVLAIGLVALDLRGPLVALPSVSGLAGRDLHVSASAVGLLTTLPVLCFGLASPLASWVVARTGLRAGVLVALGGVLVGTLVRSAGGYGCAVAGTVVMGAAITIANIAVPVVVGEEFPARVAAVTALYTAGLNVGSTATSALTPVLAVPLGWRVALAAWSVLVVVAAVGWLPLLRRRAPLPAGRGAEPDPDPDRAPAPTPVRAPVWRRPSTWGLTAAFAGQAFSYYGTTAWLPTLLADERGTSAQVAGASAAVFQVLGVVGSFGVPVLLRATGRPRVVLLVVCAGWATLPLGLLLAPGAWLVWCAVAGAAQGGGLVVVFVAVVDRAASSAEGRQLSSLVQGGGYVVGALGPTAVGAVHAATGSWTAPLAVVSASVALMLVAGAASVPRRRRVVLPSARGAASSPTVAP